MNATDLLALLLAAALGLAGGSFANVAVRRLPIVLARRWRNEALATLHIEPAAAPPFNLAGPRSHCPSCSAPIRVRHNIPVIGWLLLRGRCAACGTSISARYPLVELAGLATALATTTVWGFTTLSLLHGVFLLALLTAALIDCDTRLLPDEITLPLLWLGVGSALAFPERPGLADAVIGAAIGYLTLWGIYHLFRLITGKEGMGHGDFKMLAALGAWFGWQALPALVLIASLSGLAYALVRRVRYGAPPTDDPMGAAMPFGPFLAIGGCVTLFLHDWIVHATLFRGTLPPP
ncbi:MAG: A24 family peptidase [Gammaproteobacteria bacterium]|nr:A24 family peptidase [Gammaproteobacteria bacterium]